MTENNGLLRIACLDKWFFARWFQFFAYSSILIAGLGYRFEFQTIPDLLRNIPTEIYIPIASEWIQRVVKTYHYRGGSANLEHLLLFSWIVTLVALLVSLIIALPELLRNPLTMGNNIDKAVLVYRSLHQRIYHRWFCPHYVEKAIAKKLWDSKSDWKPKCPSAKCLAELYTESVSKSYLLTFALLGLGSLFCLSFISVAGIVGINHKDMSIGEPIFIAVTGLVFEENIIYIFSLLIVFLRRNVKRS